MRGVSYQSSELNPGLLRAFLLLAAALSLAASAPDEGPPAADALPSLPNPPDTPQSEAPKDDNACDCASDVDWTKIPPLRPLPRLGMVVLYPSGPGYYSLQAQLHHDYKEKAPNLPWGVFAFTPASAFDVDFRYLDKPDNKQHDFFDPLKRIHMGDDWLLGLGGQSWLRTMNEVDSRLTTTNNEYQLVRSRL